MDNPIDGQLKRPVRVQTRQGVVEGYLNSSNVIRLLDDLNLVTHSFRTIQSPVAGDEDWDVGDGPLAVHRESILFVMEREDAPPLPMNRPAVIEAARHTRMGLRLWVGEFIIEGFVHVPPGGRPLSRLFHERHHFMALTSAKIAGPDGTFDAPFVAINRSYVTSAREIDRVAPPLEIEPIEGYENRPGLDNIEFDDEEHEQERVAR